jgi:hypothetical protein
MWIMKSKHFIIVSSVLFLILQSCSYGDSAFGGVSESGTGGSMARFTIVGNRLFTVDQQSLNVFDISTAENPEFTQRNNVGVGVETIFPLGDKLFLGTSTGMYIYDISTAGTPRQISFYEHVIACDPVVSDGQFAYVTLNASRQECWRSVNELQIIDLQNIERPQLIKQYQMQSPRGLAVRNDTLWVCDNGLKIFDVSDKLNMAELYHFNDLSAYDLILDKNRTLVIGETGFVQYKLKGDTIVKLSEINVEF